MWMLFFTRANACWWLQNFNCGCKLKSFFLWHSHYKSEFMEHFVRKKCFWLSCHQMEQKITEFCCAWRTEALYKSLISLRIRGSDLWILSISLSYQRRIFSILFSVYFVFFFIQTFCFVSMHIEILENLLKYKMNTVFGF